MQQNADCIIIAFPVQLPRQRHTTESGMNVMNFPVLLATLLCGERS